ncbi:MAG TPA: right-handed parallel beta-helix repeat-containing protein, partial [Nitrospirota bacterium]|nr:right-handed parallel beta-helix repeat-containing protein [Nitrospirota bacterium]
MKKRTVLRVFLCAFIILLLYGTPSFAGTQVGGLISANTTWTLANSPYTVTSTVQVYGTSTSPVTLTIQPGVVVYFNSGTSLQIGSSTNLGALVAQGTSTNHITFTQSAANVTWGGINFQAGTVNSTTNLQYVDIQYSTGISMTSASPTIGYSTITNVSGYGMYLTSSNPSLQNVTISSTNSWGMYLISSNPVLNTVAVTANGTYGIYLSSSSPTITNGSLTNSSSAGYGIYGSGSPVISNYNVSIVNTATYYGCYLSSTTSSLSLTNSTITNGLYIGTTGIAPTITGNTFTNVDNSPMHAGANIIAQILSGNTITGMSSAGQIQVVG